MADTVAEYQAKAEALREEARKNASGLGGRIAESYRAGSEKIKDTATKNMDRTVQMLTEKISEI